MSAANTEEKFNSGKKLVVRAVVALSVLIGLEACLCEAPDEAPQPSSKEAAPQGQEQSKRYQALFDYLALRKAPEGGSPSDLHSAYVHLAANYTKQHDEKGLLLCRVIADNLSPSELRRAGAGRYIPSFYRSGDAVADNWIAHQVSSLAKGRLKSMRRLRSKAKGTPPGVVVTHSPVSVGHQAMCQDGIGNDCKDLSDAPLIELELGVNNRGKDPLKYAYDLSARAMTDNKESGELSSANAAYFGAMRSSLAKLGMRHTLIRQGGQLVLSIGIEDAFKKASAVEAIAVDSPSLGLRVTITPKRKLSRYFNANRPNWPRALRRIAARSECTTLCPSVMVTGRVVETPEHWSIQGKGFKIRCNEPDHKFREEAERRRTLPANVEMRVESLGRDLIGHGCRFVK